MSKAFTSEETPEEAPLLRAAPRLAPGEVRWVTPEGHAALRADRERLLADRERARALPEAERASRLGPIEGRLAVLEGTLAALTVLGPERAPAGVAAFATWVTIEDEGGRRATWRLVGPDEADARAGRLSVASPLGRALVGRAVGETVEVARPGGEAAVTIVAVSRDGPGAP